MPGSASNRVATGKRRQSRVKYSGTRTAPSGECLAMRWRAQRRKDGGMRRILVALGVAAVLAVGVGAPNASAQYGYPGLGYPGGYGYGTGGYGYPGLGYGSGYGYPGLGYSSGFGYPGYGSSFGYPGYGGYGAG